MLETIDIRLIIPLFTKNLLDNINNISSSLSTTLCFDEELQADFYSAI